MGCCFFLIRKRDKLTPSLKKKHLDNEKSIQKQDSTLQFQNETPQGHRVVLIDEVMYPLSATNMKDNPKKSFTRNLSELIMEDNEDNYFSEEELKLVRKDILQIDTAYEFVDKWAPGDLIGQGSFGTVIMAMNKNTGQVMAVKQVSLSDDQLDDEKTQSLKLEINILSKLKHKNIVSYYGVQRTNRHMNIFLEYVGGGSLYGMIKRFGNFKESLLIVYVRQILEGLIYLHDNGVVHRDIKSANILVDSQGVCKLADFGSCKRLSEIVKNSDGHRSIQGTPNYMAPEVVLQQASGRKSDIWSLGCTIIELLTGQPPWNNFTNAVTIMLKIARTNQPPPLPDGLSEEAKEFLKECLHVDPNQRLTARQLSSHTFLKRKTQLQPSPPKKRLSKIRGARPSNNNLELPDFSASPQSAISHSLTTREGQGKEGQQQQFKFCDTPKTNAELNAEKVYIFKKTNKTLGSQMLAQEEQQDQMLEKNDRVEVEKSISSVVFEIKPSINRQKQQMTPMDQLEKDKPNEELVTGGGDLFKIGEESYNNESPQRIKSIKTNSQFALRQNSVQVHNL